MLECLSSYWAEPRSDAVLSGTGRDSLLGQLLPLEHRRLGLHPSYPPPLLSWVRRDWPLRQFAGDSALTRGKSGCRGFSQDRPSLQSSFILEQEIRRTKVRK